MAVTASTTPSREDFAAMLEESFDHGNLHEGAVIKGTIVAIEKDMAVIDVGLKTEGRVAVREFTGPGRQADLKVGDTVEVYLERVENALGEAVLSRDKARREESWASWRRRSRATRRSRASSSTRSRAASRSTSTAPWRSCRAARSTSGRSAT
jgi:small subunit ribosomal protein S1